MGVRRRTVLRAAALSGVLGVPGCAGLQRAAGFGDVVRIAVSWSTAELAAFGRILATFGTEGYELMPLGDNIDAALGARTTNRPNLLALPQPGHVAANRADLAELPADLWQPEYDRIWSQQLPADEGKHYALPFKLAHGSVVWYRRKVFEALGLSPPRTWEEWLELNSAISASGVAPLALGGADGWMLAGFFENVLLRNFHRTYDALVEPAHDPGLWESDDVRATFAMLAQMWGRPEFLAGGPERALIHQFPDAVLEVFRFHRAAMVVAPDFAESVIRWFGVPEDEVGTFTFPSRSGGKAPVVVKGDLLVLTRP
ncbi:MAG: extracellular solute-binding protein, partial [Actinomycetota bacterium]|nr:extracellular solute-binding protein [Actinomycetota bacterium]